MELDVAPLLDLAEVEAAAVGAGGRWPQLCQMLGRQFAWSVPQVLVIRSMLSEQTCAAPLVCGSQFEWSNTVRVPMQDRFPMIRVECVSAGAGIKIDATQVMMGFDLIVSGDLASVSRALDCRSGAVSGGDFHAAAFAAAEQVIKEGRSLSPGWFGGAARAVRVDRELVVASAAAAFAAAHGSVPAVDAVSKLAVGMSANAVLSAAARVQAVVAEMLVTAAPQRWLGGVLRVAAPSLPDSRLDSHDNLVSQMTWQQ